MRRKQEEAPDDGRTIAEMNLEGMPWYRENDPPKVKVDAEKMTKQEARRYTLYAVLAGLTIVAVFGIAAALFILFCTDVWFR